MKHFRNIMAFALAVVLLHGCAYLPSTAIPTDLPDKLQAHPGDIRFNRPTIKWVVEDDPGAKYHVLTDEVYVQLVCQTGGGKRYF